MEIETKTLKKMLSKAIKCSSNNNMIPLTQLININYDPNSKELRLITTDIINYMIVKEDIQDVFEPINVTVKLSTLNKLLSKIKSNIIELKQSNKELVIIGSGTSRLEVFVDDDGEPLKFPVRKINENDIQLNLNYNFNFANLTANLSCINEKTINEIYTQFYFRNNLIITNKDYAASFTKSEDVVVNDFMISSKLISLILTSLSTEGQIIADSKSIKIVMCDMEVIGPRVDNSLQYPIDRLLKVYDILRENQIVFNKNEMIEIIDRCLAFDNMFEAKVLNIQINPNCLGFIRISNNHEEHVSDLELIGSETCDDFTEIENIKIATEEFKTLLASNPSDVISIYFSEGTRSPISIVSDEVVQILARLR